MVEPYLMTLPKLSNNTVEVTVISWLKVPGERVAAGEPLVAVETDKIEMEIESPVGGVVVEIHADVDEDIPVGGPLATIQPD